MPWAGKVSWLENDYSSPFLGGFGRFSPVKWAAMTWFWCAMAHEGSLVGLCTQDYKLVLCAVATICVTLIDLTSEFLH